MIHESLGKMYVLIGIVIGVVMVLPRQHVSLAQEPTNGPPQPKPEVIAAWEKAGAMLDSLEGDLSLFLFDRYPSGQLRVLPQPEVPFGIYLSGQVTAAGLKEMSGLTQLRTLGLYGTTISKDGLSELAGLTQLNSLILFGVRVTAAGQKELAGLTQLQTLSLYGTPISEEGPKALACLKQLL